MQRRGDGRADVIVRVALLAAAALVPMDAGGAGSRWPPTPRPRPKPAGAAYDRACASCHMPNLSGSFEAPELAGPAFRGGWGDQSVEALIEFTAATMPPDSPGSLPAADYALIVAYLLQANGFAAERTSR